MRPEELLLVQHPRQDPAQPASSNSANRTGPVAGRLLPWPGRAAVTAGCRARNSATSWTSPGNSVRTWASITVAAASGISPTIERTFSGMELPSGWRRTS